MASVYTNDLRLEEIGSGEQSGTWGDTTNTNLDLIADAFGFGTEAPFDTDANKTTTVADGAADPARAMYFKVTSTVSGGLTATRQLTIAPDTINRLMFIENATTGGESITIKQGSGSGAAVTIPNGDTKAVILSGSGSGSIVLDAFASLNVVDLKVQDDIFLTSDSSAIKFGLGADATLTHTNDVGITLNGTNKLMFNDASQFVQGLSNTVLALGATNEIDLTATAIDINGTVDMSSTAVIGGSLTMGATSTTVAGKILFKEGTDNGTNAVTLVGPASTADVTVTLPNAAGTIATTDDATALAIALG